MGGRDVQPRWLQLFNPSSQKTHRGRMGQRYATVNFLPSHGMSTLALRPLVYLQTTSMVLCRPFPGHVTTRRSECRSTRAGATRVGSETIMGVLRFLNGICHSTDALANLNSNRAYYRDMYSPYNLRLTVRKVLLQTVPISRDVRLLRSGVELFSQGRAVPAGSGQCMALIISMDPHS
jgi:hypothetical protein